MDQGVEGASYPETVLAGVEEEGVVGLSYVPANFVPSTADQVCTVVVGRPLSKHPVYR